LQKTHEHHIPSKRNKEIILLCDHITSPANQGAIFRLADAFGVKEIIFLGNTPDTGSSRLKKTARSTQERVAFTTHQNGVELLQNYNSKGFQSIALEITENSVPLSTIEITTEKLIVILGNEQTGISLELLELANQTTHIKMYGHNSSMNVAQAAAVALYQLSL